MKLKKFEEFTNEESINEDADYYLKKGWVDVSDEFEYVDDLIEDVQENIEPALNKFLSRHNLPPVSVSSEEDTRRGKITFSAQSKPISDIGVFEYSLSKVTLGIFNRFILEYYEDLETGQLLTAPNMWATLSLFYEQKAGGRNGVEVYLDSKTGNSIWYSIIGREVHIDI